MIISIDIVDTLEKFNTHSHLKKKQTPSINLLDIL